MLYTLTTVSPPSQTELCHRLSTPAAIWHIRVSIFTVNLSLEPLKNLCPEASPPTRLVCSKISQNVWKKRDGDVEIHEKNKSFRKNESIVAFLGLFFRTAGLLSRPRDLRVEAPARLITSQSASFAPSSCLFQSREVPVTEARNGFTTQVVR